MSTQDRYALGYRREEQERLLRQAEELAEDSTHLFDAIGIEPGHRVLEIGCGPRGCLDLLSQRVGVSGNVVGIELSPSEADTARSFVDGLALGNVEIICGDARAAGLEPESFDFVTGRLVLVNVPEPEEIIQRAVALTKPGGVVAFHEIDWAAVMCEPPSEEWTALIDMILAVSNKNGSDYFLGRKLPRLLRAAGLSDIRARGVQHCHPVGDPRRELVLIFADNFRDRIVEFGLMSAEAFSRLRQELATQFEDPERWIFLGPYIQSWGRKAIPPLAN